MLLERLGEPAGALDEASLAALGIRTAGVSWAKPAYCSPPDVMP
jgi:hypothetical protein